jgi:xanthine/uracil permease
VYLILCVVTSSYLLQVLNSFLSAGLAQTDACSVFAGKFGGIFASVPQPMVAAIFCILFAYFGSTGISCLQFLNMNSQRNIFVVGFSLFMALSVPQYFREYTISAGHGPAHTQAHWFDDIINVTFSSSATVAMIVAVTLDNSLKASRKDRGLLWWDKFRNFGSDPRNLEFYRLPLGLNKFFPPT